MSERTRFLSISVLWDWPCVAPFPCLSVRSFQSERKFHPCEFRVVSVRVAFVPLAPPFETRI